MISKKILLAAAALLAPATPGFAQAAGQGAAPAPAAPGAKAPASKPDAASTTVKEVTVTGEAGFRSSIDRRSYDVSKDLGASSGSIADALRNVPSVEVDVNGGVSLRGDANVTILVDGKPSAQFKGASAAQALQQLPAAQIERVEVMTNPSAQYSPDGSAGIINLVTKKTRKPGRSGGARVNVASGGRLNGGVNGAWRGGKLTLSADAQYRRDPQAGSSSTETSGLDALSQPFSQHGRTSNRGRGAFKGGRVSLDYDLDPKNRLSAEAFGGEYSARFHSVSSFEADGPTGAPVSAFTRDTRVPFSFGYSGASATWRHTFAGDGHDLVVSLSRNQNRNHNDQSWVEYETLPTPQDTAESRLRSERTDQTELKADYQRPMPRDGKLKTGLQLQVTDTTQDNAAFLGASLQALVPNPAQTDLFEVEQTLGAVYATYEQPVGDLTVLGGLRAEQTRLRLNDVTTSQTDRNSYWKVYPSLHLGWKLDQKQQLSASYSERVQRPNPADYDPFVVRNTPFSATQGNPDLRPQQTRSYELGWQRREGMTFYLATLYYRTNRNGVTDVQTPLSDGVILTTKENLAESRSGGLELVANGKITKTLSYNLSGDARWTQIDGSTLGFSGRPSDWALSGRGSLNWQATPKDLLQLNGNLTGKQLTPQGYRLGWGRLNVGWRHKFDDRFSLVVTGQDVLAGSRFGQVLDTSTLKSRSSFVPKSRVVFVGLTYTFGAGGKRDPGFDYGGGQGAGGAGGGPTS